jgi:hypothetical protein
MLTVRWLRSTMNLWICNLLQFPTISGIRQIWWVDFSASGHQQLQWRLHHLVYCGNTTMDATCKWDKHLRAPIRMILFFTFWVCIKPGMGTSRIDYVLCSTSIVSAIQFRWLCTPLHFQTLYVRPVLVPHYISCKLCFRICSVHSAAIITTFVTSNWSLKKTERRAEQKLFWQPYT